MIYNSYNEEDKREQILNHAINIKFESNIYIIPTTIYFRQINHRSHSKNDYKWWDTYAHPKELPLGKDYADEFTTETVNNSKFNDVKEYACWNIKTEIPYNKFLYNNDEDKEILPLFCKNNIWLKCNKLSTQREASIGLSSM